MLINKSIVYFVLLALMSCNINAGYQNNVNILTWEGIFDSSEIIKQKLKHISSTCRVNISFDNYSNHSDFLNQLSTHDYDYNIVIAPNTFLNLITAEIPRNQNIQAKEIPNYYNPYVKKHYNSVKLPPNVLYFLQSITGILINTDLIKQNRISTIYDLLNSIDNNMMLLMLDDPIELSSIMERSKKHILVNNSSVVTIKNINDFDRLANNKNITIVNFFNERMKQSNFAASISWSGDAIRDILLLNNNGNTSFRFEMPKNISFVSTDLLIQLKRDYVTDCVTTMIASKDFIDAIAYETNYFSPFITEQIKAKNKIHYDIQKQYIDYLKNAYWLDAVTNYGFNEVHYEWEKFKFNTVKNKNKKFLSKS